MTQEMTQVTTQAMQIDTAEVDRAYGAMIQRRIAYLQAKVDHYEASHRAQLDSSPTPPDWALQVPRYTVSGEDSVIDTHGYWAPAQMMIERLEEIWRVAWAWGYTAGSRRHGAQDPIAKAYEGEM